jgi:hypothetical protein
MRLLEFQATPAALLTLKEFDASCCSDANNDDDNECDPPSFCKSTNGKWVIDLDYDTCNNQPNKKARTNDIKCGDRFKMYDEIYKDLIALSKKEGESKKVPTAGSSASMPTSTGYPRVDQLLLEAEAEMDCGSTDFDRDLFDKKSKRNQSTNFDRRIRILWNQEVSSRNKGMIKTPVNITQSISKLGSSLNSKAITDEVLDSLISDKDIDSFILPINEQKKKADLWERMHGSYVREAERKRALTNTVGCAENDESIVAAHL